MTSLIPDDNVRIMWKTRTVRSNLSTVGICYVKVGIMAVYVCETVMPWVCALVWVCDCRTLKAGIRLLVFLLA